MGPHLVDRSNQGEVVYMVNDIGTTNLGGLHIYLAIYLYNNLLSGHRRRRKKVIKWRRRKLYRSDKSFNCLLTTCYGRISWLLEGTIYYQWWFPEHVRVILDQKQKILKGGKIYVQISRVENSWWSEVSHFWDKVVDLSILWNLKEQGHVGVDR